MSLRPRSCWYTLLLGLLIATGIAGPSILAIRAANCVSPPTGLTAWWSGNGTTADSLGSHPGALQNRASFQPGEAGLAFALDGSGGYVSAAPSAAWAFDTNAFSIELWANFAAGGDRVLVSSDAGGGSNNKWLFWLTGGNLRFHVNNAAGNAVNIGSATLNPTLGQWYHLAVTRSGTNFTFYVNGAPFETNSAIVSIPDSGAPLTIGSAENNFYFSGLLDEVSIYNRALTAADIQSVFQAGAAGKCGAVAAGGSVPYFTDFESGTGPEWAVPGVNQDFPAIFSRFSGRFGNQSQTLVMTNLVPGQVYKLGFDFYVLDSWDGGSDIFDVGINGTSVFHESFANYNGNPPSGNQSYPGAPDEGRADFGFTQGYVDAIYRNIEISFTASNSVTAIDFTGLNLENLDNESWGLDNVSVLLASSLPAVAIRSTTLPGAGTSAAIAYDSFTVSASHPLDPATAIAASSWSLKSAGPDGTLGNADDVVIPLSASSPGPGGRSVSFSLASAPLQPGLYRFQSANTLLDTNNAAVPIFTRDFTIANPVAGAIENLDNDEIATATSLPLAESPAGSSFFTGFGIGTFSSTSDVDYWRIDAEAGDHLTFQLEAEQLSVYPQVYLQNPSGQNVATFGGDYYGRLGFQNYVFGSPGTYYLRVFSNNRSSRYAMRLDLARGPLLETEDNSSPSTANVVSFDVSNGQYLAKVAGAFPSTDGNGDYYAIGTLNPGNVIAVQPRFPAGSILNTSALVTTIEIAGNPVPVITSSSSLLNYTVASNGFYYIHVQSATAGLRSQYLLQISISDSVPPVVVGTTLPAEGGSSTAIIDRFTVSASEDLSVTAASNPSNYEMRGAGVDNTFGTADDTIYHFSGISYSSGLTISYSIGDGPLQPGKYRFTISTNLTDRAGNGLSSAYVRNFTVVGLPHFANEGRNDDTGGLGTSLGVNPSAAGNGSFGAASSVGTGANPYWVASGRLNADTSIDLAVANGNSGNVSILTNNGTGGFTLSTNIATGGLPVALAIGDLNHDGTNDIAVVNYNSGTLTILLGQNNGLFQVSSNYPGFSNPSSVAIADFNGDSFADIAVANWGNGTVQVLLGDGTGIFTLSTNYSTGSGAVSVAIGDLNHDGKADLAVANYYSSTVSIFAGVGDGSFIIQTNMAVGANPRFVSITDVSGDGVQDLVVDESTPNTVGIWLGNGDLTFKVPHHYLSGAVDSRQLALVDLNGDAKPEIVIPGFGNNRVGVLLNDGSGSFTNLTTFGIGNGPICVAAGDFSGDGRKDLAFANYYGGGVSIWTSNPSGVLAEDPVGSGLFTGFGRGIRSTSGDVDFYQFSGNAGDLAVLAVDVPGNPAGSSLYYEVDTIDGNAIASFGSDYSGWGESGVFTLPQTGTYLVRVAANYDFEGEYRVRLTLARPPLQLINETTGGINQVRPVALSAATNHLKASVAGYIGVADSGGDYFPLGNLLAGATVSLTLKEPSSSGLSEVLSTIDSTGAVITNSAAGASQFTYNVPVGKDGYYYVRVTAAAQGFAPGAETAVTLNGNGSDVELGTWFNNQVFSVAMWVNPAASQNYLANLLDNNHQGGINWTIEQDQGNNNHYIFGLGDGSAGVPFTLAPNVWQHLAIVRDSTNINHVYINGVEAGHAAGSGQINYDGNQFLRIGAWGGGSRYWTGSVDEVRVWDHALTAAEIVAGMTGNLTGSEAGLSGYWRFNEGSGTNSVDQTASHHDAHLIGGASWLFISPISAVPPGLGSQYILGLDISSATSPAVVSDSLPAAGQTSTNLITDFDTSFNTDVDPVFSRLGRSVLKFGGLSYFISDSPTDWDTAEAAAVATGGHLADIASSAENAWITQNFGSLGEWWIGLHYNNTGTGFAWSSGAPFSYSNWNGGEPNNSGGNEFAVEMTGGGGWSDIAPANARRGVIKISSTTDTDGDGLVDVIDPYPSDPLNAFDLRASGPDGVFDTSDDVVYHVVAGGYASGLTAHFSIVDGPLQPGTYRFKVTTSLRDRFGRALPSAYVHNFSIAPLPGFVEEGRSGTGFPGSTSIAGSISNRLDGSFTGGGSFSAGRNPYSLTSGRFNQDTNLDLVTANYSDNNITVLLGDGTGQFQVRTNMGVGSNPISVVTADFNGDGKLDLAVANYSDGSVSILLGVGDGTFSAAGVLTGLHSPANIAVGDFNKDNKLDLAVPNAGNGTVQVFLGDGLGGFTPGAVLTLGNTPWTVVSADIDKDGKLDLAVAVQNSSSIFIALGNGDGTFKTPQSLPAGADVRALALGDLTGDGNLDIAAVGPGGRFSVLLGNGDGSFQPVAVYDLGLSDSYQVVLFDADGNGTLDAVIPSYGNSRGVIAFNSGAGVFGGSSSFTFGGNPISVALGDFNSDTRPDLAFANYTSQSVTVFFGNDRELLNVDTAGTGLLIGAGRGKLTGTGDVDYWTFTATVGDRLAIGVENPGNPNSSGLHFTVYRPDGSYLTDFYGDGQGRGQVGTTIPASGTYSLRVDYNYQYFGEYQFRVTLAKAPIQIEQEDNGSISAANTLAFDVAAGVQSATVLGFISNADGSGDYFRLGNLAAATLIQLKNSRPATSALYPVVEIYNSSGSLVTNGLPGQTNVAFTVPAGQDGAYYAHVASSYGARTSSNTNGLYFNGGNNYINTGAWTPGVQWSVQAWVMASSLPGGRHTVAGGLGACRDWGITLQDGHFGALIRPPGGCTTSLTAPAPAVPGVWYHLASVVDGTNAFFYVNGVLQASSPVDVNYLPYEGGTWIGGEVCCGSYFPGVIQDVSIWSRPLLASEVNGFMAHRPSGSETGLVGYWQLQDGTGTSVTDLSPGGHNGTLVNNPSWITLAPVGALSSGLMQQYLLSISLVDTVPPQVLAVSDPIPAEGTTTSSLIDRFSLTFSGDMSPATVTSNATYELRGAGADSSFGTADDVLYTVANAPTYSSGTQASYQILNGPLQAGLYRFTVKTTLANKSGTPLASAFVRNFAVTNISGFILEGRFDDSIAQGVSLSANPSTHADGTITRSSTLPTGSNPYYLTAGLIDADANLDLVVANYSSANVSVLRGLGDGTFVVRTNYPTGPGPVDPVLARFDGDAKLDLAVVNYQAGTVSIFIGLGDGTFQVVTNYNVGTSPHFAVAADLNGDGKTDLAIANYGSSTVSVLLGNGDGTFQPQVTYSTGSNPHMIAVADFNGDGRLDLVTPNYGVDSLTLLLGNGDGTFAPGINIPSGVNPMSIAVADFNADGKRDLVVSYGSESVVSIYSGNGDGSFQPRMNLDTGSANLYQVLGVDMNGDGLPDVVASSYNASAVIVILNKGGGAFETRSVYGSGSNPVGMVAGDWNGDGRLDLATADYGGGGISVYLGGNTELLGLDPGTGIRTGAGRGILSTTSDTDFWEFDANSGDGIAIASENPGAPGASGLHFTIYRPDGSYWSDFYGDYYGRGQVSGVAPVSGTYSVRVDPNYGYTGEYRIRVSLVPSTIQLESEDNGNINNANGLTLVGTGGHRKSQVYGYISSADGGDFFNLGSVAAGATIGFTMAEPASSGLLGSVSVVDSAGNILSNSVAGATSFSYAIPAGGDGVYYARVIDAGPLAARTFGGSNGFALRFDGGSDWVSIPTGPIPQTGDFTVECWAYSFGSSSYREIISQGTGGNAFYLGTDGGNIRSGDNWGNTGYPFPFTGWHHYAVVKTASSTQLFVDGAVVASLGSGISNPAAGEFRIGRQYGPYGEYWNGGIDEVRVWSSARSTNQIAQNMTNRLAGTEAGLAGYWRFDEGTGAVLHDAGPGGFSGAIQDHPIWLPSNRTGVQPSNIFSQYVLGVDIHDTTPPAITGVTLPAAGSTNYGLVSGFTLSFTKDLDPAINALNRDIRVVNGHAYTPTAGGSTWQSAETQARAVGGHLVTVNDSAENAWLAGQYGSLTPFWIGLTDEAQKNSFVWTSGQSLLYTNWANGNPSTSGNQDYAYFGSDGKWVSVTGNNSYNGIIEVSGTDTDGDGIADSLDPFPLDPLNVFDLRAAGPDGQFDTPDDQTYRLLIGSYTSGGSLSFNLYDGPLQPGSYRFTVTTALKDLAGNALTAPFIQFFTIGSTTSYVIENRSNNSAASATPIVLIEDIPGAKTGGGRGMLSPGSDVDFWSFTGKAGDSFSMAVMVPGAPGASALYYAVYKPGGALLVDLYAAYTGDGQTATTVLPVDGTYTIQVSHYYGYTGEYRLRVTAASPPLLAESEDNGTIGGGNPITFVTNGNARSGSIVGTIRTPGDLDYFNLGTVTNGASIVLTLRLPGSSGLVPVVSVYNSSGIYQAEVAGNPTDDGTANVPITVDGNYFALVRPSNGTGGIDDQYVLDVQVVPTGSLNFPNLVVSSISVPTAVGILSGQTVNYSYTVKNIGNTATPGASWIDRAGMSGDTILGNADDAAVGFFAHNGALAPGASYAATNALVIPDGLAGDFHIIVQTDAGNSINELLFENDNTTASTNTFHVDVAPYPDLTVENLAVSGPDSNHQYTITWKTANRGLALAGTAFTEHLTVINQTTGTTLKSLNLPVASGLATNATVAHSQTVTATDAGVYAITVTTDSAGNLFEFNGGGHIAAEANNTATTQFQITVNFAVSAVSSPAGAGTITGAGSFASGTPVTVIATPNTGTLPYQFVNWTEGGAFQSGISNYTFVLSRDRTLTANFTLPAYVIAASNSPAGAGSVSGQGTYFFGATNVLTAVANFGYRFTNWTENGSMVGTVETLTTVVRTNHTFVAHYAEANTIHVVSTGTFPTNVAVVSGAGSYTNGQTATIIAPLSVTNPPNVYTFHEFRANGNPTGGSSTLHKLFSTLDPTNASFIAYYDSVSIKPLVTNAIASIPNPVGATTNFLLSLQFNRSMDTNFAPIVLLTNKAAGAVQAAVQAAGSWGSTANPNDTYTPPAITFSSGMDGTNSVLVSHAKDMNGSLLDSTNVMDLVVDVTPPLNPSVGLIASNSVSATVSWQAYLAPVDLNGFRIYIAPTNFSTVAGLTAVSAVGSSTRTFVYPGLSLDTDYYAAVTAVDSAGNSAPSVTPLKIRLPSTIPPLVSVGVAAASSSSASISWPGYNTSGLFGFSGFRLYYETANFNSVSGLTARQSLTADARSATATGLDRTKTYYFAVVGYNGTNGFNTTVVTGSWSDPYAGVISSDLTLGGGGENTVDVLHDIIVANNAVLTIPAGTTVRFAPGTGITVQQGAIHADGTPLDPIVFTSANDQLGGSPSAGDWKGVSLQSGANTTLLRHVFVKYGAGLRVTNAAPVVDAFTALYNNPAGLALFNGATIGTTNALLAYNGYGAEQSGTSRLSIHQSVIKNNGTNAFTVGGATAINGQGNWWGSAAGADVTGSVTGPVDTSSFLVSEPILTPAIGTVGNLTQVSTQTVPLRLASRTADAMRVSEDSTFAGVFFSPFTNNLPFLLSSGGGQKTIFAQFRSVTGSTNPPISLSVDYVTQGPTITSFSLEEGDSLTRPILVTGAATAPLGIFAIELYVDGIGAVTNSGGAFSQWFDIRGYSGGIHRVELLARDNGGAIAVSAVNLSITPTPPAAPVITAPVDHKVVNTPTIAVSGTAEPYLGVRIVKASIVLATGNADATGHWTFPAVPLAEGNNALAAVSFDTLGSASSAALTVTLSTGPPAAVVQDAPFYSPSDGLTLNWHYPVGGTAATHYQVLWNLSPFTSTNGILGNGPLVTALSYRLPSMPAGYYYFGIIGYDDAGNASAVSNLQPFAYDPFPPSFAIGFDKPSPAGVGFLTVTLTASKALSAPPSLTLKWPSSSPIALTVTNSSFNTYVGVLNVTPFTSSGLIDFEVSAQDLLGNVFQGPPSGSPMVIDVALPTGAIATAPLPPIQTTNSTNIAVNLTLSKPAKAGTVPQLSFAPPSGSTVPLVLTGSGTNWTTSLALTPAMGSGFGAFTFSVSDGLGNVGQVLTAGGFLEIYNSAHPSPPSAPTIYEVASVPGGGIKLSWTTISNAETYRIYGKAGTNGVPTDLVADGLTATTYTNFPATDGFYRLAVTASRRGSEGTNSNVITGISDRTPPPVPVNLAVELGASGVKISWTRGTGPENPAYYYHVYRNGTLIQNINGSADTDYTTTDSPPRGSMTYKIGALDSIGNESFSDPASIELLVGAVTDFTVLVNEGQAPYLAWTSNDPTAVGFNVYRDGIKQNPVPLPAAAYLDSLGMPSGGAVTYVVKAVNSTNAESAARTVTATSLTMALGVNVVNGTNQALIQRYFDDYRLSVTNLTVSNSVVLDHVELIRTLSTGDTLTRNDAAGFSIAGGNFLQREVVFPGALVPGAQSVMVRAIQAANLGGSKVIYQRGFDFGNVVPPTSMIDVSAAQPPLAGGLATLNVRVNNRGYAPMDLLVARDGGTGLSDLGISLINQYGQEVGHADFKAIPPGSIFAGDGRVFMRVPAGQSTQLTVTNILVPESLGTNGLFFQATYNHIYYDLGGNSEVAGGPLQGGMVSSLAVTPYFGSAQTDHPFYANDDPVVITGQALDRLTQNPVPNVPLKIGFSISGTKFYQDVTTDSSGNYQYVYNPPQGLSGTVKLWAAHPAVFDVLNQAQITIYRVYMSPAQADLRMSKNDHLDFSAGLINPGDATLTGFQLETLAYRMDGTNQIVISNLTATVDLPDGFVAGPKAVQQLKFRLTATLDAPDNAIVRFRMRSAEGAVAELDANVMLLPAQPLLSVTDPSVGYAEVSVNRGALVSKTVTVVNQGLRDLKGVTLSPPTNVTWISVNLPLGGDGKVHLPDMAVGATNQFTLVFAPPAGTALDFYKDQFILAGTNADATFPVGVYALVTSSVKGDVKFYVDDILVEPVPNATIRIKNTLIEQEFTAKTDANGFVTITNLQEGSWAWQTSAPGYSTTVGVVDIVGGQVVMQETRLSKSLVTVNFTVVPVPFTDRYEITIEQTFETHVPAPVLVLTPPNMDFRSVGPGYDVTFLVTAKNYGLIQMTDLKIEGMTDTKGGTLTPLITYVPLLRAEESVIIPFRFTYGGSLPGGGGGGEGKSLAGKASRKFDGPGFADCSTGGLAGLADFLSGLMAFANAHAQCVDARAALAILGSLAVTYALLCAPSFSPLGLLPSPCPSGGPVGWVISFFINALSCFCQARDGGCFGSSDSGGSGPGGGPTDPVFTKYGGGGPECFEAGTQVMLADGQMKPIEQIHTGDIVKTGTRDLDKAMVGSVESHVVNGVYQIEFGSGHLHVTGEHLIWLDGQGWTEARRIHSGDWLMGATGQRVQVTGVTREPRQTTVYSFTNQGDHAFLANGMLVHDQCGRPAQLNTAIFGQNR